MRPARDSCGRNNRTVVGAGDAAAVTGDGGCIDVVGNGYRHRTTTHYHTMSHAVGDNLNVDDKDLTTMRGRTPWRYTRSEQEGKV